MSETKAGGKRRVSSLDELPSARAYFRRIGAEIRSLRTAVVRKSEGRYWRDVATITVSREGVITAHEEYRPTEEEKSGIAAECATVEFPSLRRINAVITPLPIVREARPEDVFEFRGADGLLTMLQVRVETDGNKRYVPVTYWSDDVWRLLEPEGALPLYGLDQVQDCHTVFIHEGAKAARLVAEMTAQRTPETRQKLAAHPWGRELSGAVHLGWIGGALSPARTDWQALVRAGVKRAYIVSDNDEPGIKAVPQIAFRLPIVCFHVQFTSEWPESFDLGDDFPQRMFAQLDGERRYIGPSFRECLHPATWATDLRSPGLDEKGNPKRPVAVLRDSFNGLWAYVETADLFVCKELPDILRTEQVANKILAPFSHVAETTRLVVKAFQGRTARLCYRPDVDGRVVTDGGTSAINLHMPSEVRSANGSWQPWLDYMRYVFPDEEECRQVLRWCATLIARPAIRMHFGLLLVSERQGIGKTTLGSAILAPLLGIGNVGWPSESDIATSAFNGWLANKRLIFVNEIYSGHSWKAYNNLKSVITDTQITVNQKHQKQYTIDSWCHVIACSNSLRALRMDKDDRRWFYPRVAETPWSKAQFASFRRWLASGGLGVIKAWAEQMGDYVAAGERPMDTLRKRELIEGSRTEGAAEAALIAEMMAQDERPIALTMQSVVMHVRAQVQGRVFESEGDLRKAMTDEGCFVTDERLKCDGRIQHVVFNAAAADVVRKATHDENGFPLAFEYARARNDAIRSCLRRLSELLEPTI